MLPAESLPQLGGMKLKDLFFLTLLIPFGKTLLFQDLKVKRLFDSSNIQIDCCEFAFGWASNVFNQVALS